MAITREDVIKRIEETEEEFKELQHELQEFIDDDGNPLDGFDDVAHRISETEQYIETLKKMLGE